MANPKPGDPPESKIEYTSGGVEIKCSDPKVKVVKDGVEVRAK